MDMPHIGSLPVPVIGGVLGLAVVGTLYFRSSRKAAASVGPTAVAVPDVGDGNLNTSAAANNSAASTSSVPMFNTNASWTMTAVAWDIASYGDSPLAVSAALAAYLEGDQLTYDQGQMVDRILAKWGLPPQGVQAVSLVDPKAPVFKDPPAADPVTTPATSGSAGTGAAGGLTLGPGSSIFVANPVSLRDRVGGTYTPAGSTRAEQATTLQLSLQDAITHLAQDDGSDPARHAMLMRNVAYNQDALTKFNAMSN